MTIDDAFVTETGVIQVVVTSSGTEHTNLVTNATADPDIQLLSTSPHTPIIAKADKGDWYKSVFAVQSWLRSV